MNEYVLTKSIGTDRSVNGIIGKIESFANDVLNKHINVDENKIGISKDGKHFSYPFPLDSEEYDYAVVKLKSLVWDYMETVKFSPYGGGVALPCSDQRLVGYYKHMLRSSPKVSHPYLEQAKCYVKSYKRQRIKDIFTSILKLITFR